ncbi:hypothetical protein, partial [Algoriphagus aquimarinus]|uniref:hypothetical protein n=1 Tax=Algoriphagus aquimarinus TaxID=237018 RepID=UPI0030D9819D
SKGSIENTNNYIKLAPLFPKGGKGDFLPLKPCIILVRAFMRIHIKELMLSLSINALRTIIV